MMPEQEEKSDHLRRLLAIVDSTLSQLFSLPPLAQDDSPTLGQIDCDGCLESPSMNETSMENVVSQRGKWNDAIKAPETSSDDLISLDFSVPLQSQTLSEIPERCLICDDVEWGSTESPDKSVSADKPCRGNQETLEEIDNVVRAILTSLSSDKASQTTKSLFKKAADTPNFTRTLCKQNKIKMSPSKTCRCKFKFLGVLKEKKI